MELAGFNVNHGFTESVVRGLRSGFLQPEDYRRISTADTLEDVRSALEETDYGTFLQDEPSPLFSSTIAKRSMERLADEFSYVKAQSNEPLTTFMDFIAREKVIDNVCMIIQGVLNQKAPAELQEKIHPLGKFEGIKEIMSESFDVQNGFDDVYHIFLQDSPIGPYFDEYIKASNRENKDEAPRGFERNQVGGILNKQDLELMKATLKKAWLEDFYKFCMGIGGTTAEVMGEMLRTEADFRVLLVTLNAIPTNMGEDEKKALMPFFGNLYPEGTHNLAKAWNETTARTALEPYKQYLELFDEVKQFYEQSEEGSNRSGSFQSIEDLIYKENAKMYEMAFEQQYHFGVFYAWVKLREQEVRNIRWIADMITLSKKDRIDSTIVPIFQPRMN